MTPMRTGGDCSAAASHPFPSYSLGLSWVPSLGAQEEGQWGLQGQEGAGTQSRDTRTRPLFVAPL